MIAGNVDATGVLDYLEATKLNIFAALRVGMGEAMVGLSYVVAGHTGGDPIISRSGKFVGAVLGSPKVTEREAYIKGTVSGMVGGKPMGVWFDEGTKVPAVAGTLFHFTAADGDSVFTHGHQAFQVAPHPIMNPSLREYSPTIMEIISEKVAEAVNVSA